MPGIEKRLARYPQLYSKIGFAHGFDKPSQDETHHILEYKWQNWDGEQKCSPSRSFSESYARIPLFLKIYVQRINLQKAK